MNILDRLRAAWRSFVSSFDYVPPPALQPTEAADTQVMTEPLPPAKPEPAALDDATRAMLAKIAVAEMRDLPMMITRQAQNPDGSPVIGPDGRVVLLNQDGTPLSVVQQAIMRRIEELRWG